jgi:hypothetical protein
MKTKLLIGLVFGAVGTCTAQQVLGEYEWPKLAQAGQLLSGTTTSIDGRAVLKVVNTNNTPLRAQLIKLLKPGVTKKFYAIEGEIKYEAVHGTGYLETWNYFPPAQTGEPEGAYFSRTLGESGDMGKITGTSEWRRFMLPFDWTSAKQAPTRLELNLFLPGEGTVYVGSLKLVEYAGSFGFNRAAAQNAWWPDWAGGVIGGIGGAVLGCLGSLLAWLASKGRARGFVLATLKSFIVLGVLSAIAGIVALGLRQPYGVWFVPMLLGAILLLISPPRLKQYQRRYDELELRKMVAMDA